MTSYSPRRLAIIGLIGVIVVAATVAGSLGYDRLPFFTAAKAVHSAYFADSNGIDAGAPVQVSGFQVGAVTSVELDGDRVRITFNMDKSIRLGDRTEAAIKAKSLLGAKIIELTPRGSGQLDAPIPLDRTTPAYELPDALGDLAQTVDSLNTDKLNESLSTLAQTFKDTPSQFKDAVAGVARFSQVLNDRDTQLRDLLANANKSTSVLAQRSDQVVAMIVNTNALLAQLQTQSSALDQISGNISALSRQLSGFVADNRTQLRGALDKLNGVLAIVDGRKERVQQSLKLLNAYAMSLGESVSSGPFFKAYVANLLPGQFVQPYIDAAFSDLGLDQSVLLPSERVDPQIGQPGTPALPVPYPRTGQGGDPNQTLPDAITGNPDDPRYPYRQPLPAPPPGGPPPGPPAVMPPKADGAQQ
ncbi:phospholipid/cholesterol/gamma-HCH transport system substrate-binding protein [Mycobacterium sp. OAS707]|uniref:MCE family protein n=1 Tax=Mycobacterium sp. OAS707 TaxID=2663822 RepID=UPI00178AD228|nr:MCE family protein [Mycobacterium sp. OAS707]MBE1549598.1 phospholipid/cholesterol/gamma-HCH transport system substrate-binding protein [Mycobacterium sp. OAS707]